MEPESEQDTDETEKIVCPECGSEVIVVSRCLTCLVCGWSLCSL